MRATWGLNRKEQFVIQDDYDYNTDDDDDDIDADDDDDTKLTTIKALCTYNSHCIEQQKIQL